MAFIQGYIATLEVPAGSPINQWASDAGLTLNNETLDKTTLGSPERVFIPGLQSGSMTVTMHLDSASLVQLQAAFAATTVVGWLFRPGQLGTHDAGQYTGEGIIDDMTIAGSVDDNWTVSISITVSGPVAFTQPV